jgi:hypothetical protein
MPFLRLVAPFAASLALAASSGAQSHAHSAAASGQALGTVHFPTSCAPGVSPTFDRAVALLHSFEFGASVATFGEVASADPGCAMAQWGIAMSRWSNPMTLGAKPAAQLAQGRAAAEAGLRLAANATDRERLYLAAVSELYKDHERVDQRTRVLAYERAMADLVSRQPADTEARIFHAIALTATAAPTDKSYARQLEAGATLERLWLAQPNHPGLAHYIIHSYDVPALASRAAAAARRYAMIAPSAAHALHMPSHTFTRVGEWEASIETNGRSRQAALASGATAEALHAADYAVYAHLQLAQDSAAKALLDTLPALESRLDLLAVTGAAPASAGVFALAAIPARYALERRDWKSAAALAPRSSAFPWTDAMIQFARSLGSSRLGDSASARVGIDSLGALQARLVAARESYWAEQVAIQQLGARAWLELGARRPDSALALMREAARREDATEKSAVSPGPLLPARELLGDMLLELGRPREALAEYRATIAREPNRYRALDGAERAARQAGDTKASAAYATALARLTATGDATRRRRAMP